MRSEDIARLLPAAYQRALDSRQQVASDRSAAETTAPKSTAAPEHSYKLDSRQQVASDRSAAEPTAPKSTAAPEQSYHTGGPLGALLEVMEALHEASEEQLSHVEDLFHPYRCPERMLPFLARWLAVEHLGSRRDLIKGGAALAQSRGTLAGLRQAIRLSTGVSDVDIEEAGPFHLVIRLPAGCTQVEKIRHLVELEKPAATTFEIGVQQ